MPNYDFLCQECGHTTVENYPHAERPAVVPCRACGSGNAQYRIAAANVMSVALPDGTKREGFAELREASKLNLESATAKPDRKKEIREEIKKMRVDIRRDGPV